MNEVGSSAGEPAGSGGSRFRTLLSALAAITGSVALAAAYPPLEFAWLAWCALVPLLVLSAYSAPGRAFRWGFVGGFVFWALSLVWLRRLADTGANFVLAYSGWLLLAAYCAIYFGIFAYAMSAWFRRMGTADWRINAAFVGFAGIMWVGLEHVRGVLCTGFPWNYLGVSQYANVAVRQVAELGGVFAVSFVVIAVNAGLAAAIVGGVTVFKTSGNDRAGRLFAGLTQAARPILAALVLVALALAFGARAMGRYQPAGVAFKIAAVQPCIEQTKKWPDEWAADILEKLDRLTGIAALPDADLIVWPETAVPSYALWDRACNDLITNLLTNGIPILVGTMDFDPIVGETNFFNSSVLYDVGGRGVTIYRKEHLVPFGEYIPLSGLIPALKSLAPLGWSCAPGRERTILRTGKRMEAPFSVLICFEDIFPSLSRAAVKKGARLLINQTNDAWFDRTSGSRQHMANAVFRCIEYRVPMVRVTNTGVTCFIDRWGNTEILADSDGSTLIEGFLVSDVLIEPDVRPTVYARAGDRGATACAFLAVVCFVALFSGGRMLEPDEESAEA